ncbi:MAG: MauE/DoxX family redox-associated membrane protein [Bacteroidota bacterium]|nr:DoxX family membrane protein [Candidatus Kapabacteria bacterium]MDW8220863.1 MauE/DoxX family redox-associated membrane protein [Bacteroidota bacterium]
MQTILFHPVVVLASRLVLGSVFVVAGVEKIAQPHVFAKAIDNYQMLPSSLVQTMALILPWIEVVSGILLVFGVRLRANSAIVAGMLVVFLIAIGSAMARDLDIDCGCYSQGGGEKIGWKKVAEDVGLLILAVQIFVAASRNDILPFSLEATQQDEVHTPPEGHIPV